MEQRMLDVAVYRFANSGSTTGHDQLVVEEPLEIRLEYGPREARTRKSISITMRTPGDDFALAAGFLFSEQIVRHPAHILRIRFCGPPVGPRHLRNTVRVELDPAAEIAIERLERHFYTTSSCGVCGKTSIEALQLSDCPPLPSTGPHIPATTIHQLPEHLRAAQEVFESTGGLHAAALVTPAGQIELLREDVGRHNAVDKLIGTRLLAGSLQLNQHLLFVSGRASFELTQKAVVAGIPILAAVGAPSSLAVALAEAHGLTLIGFVRDHRFNVYTCPWRVLPHTHTL
ncbi:MAG: formate dehydrogenase accessory sulfurtransferase FdhD [Chloroflexi bacterium SZAS-1]|nr:formate dehydrogenase accessory sulfurtransferase FdhD [Chloroflexi bacterium SZAS-1]